MKNFIKILIFSLFAITSYAQQATEIDSKSVKLPRYADLTAIQSALPLAQEGSVVYNSDSKSTWNFDGNQWKEISACFQFHNIKVFEFTNLGNLQSFVVPMGVEKIMIEMWGGGGKGIQFASGNSKSGGGGGGGGYVKAFVPVTPGQNISVLVGSGATVSNNFSGGTNSIVELALSNQLHAGGGFNSTGISSSVEIGKGGIFLNLTGLGSVIGINGQPGKSTKRHWEQSSTTNFVEIFEFGDGGDAGGTSNTGGKGPYNATNATDGFIRAESHGNGKGIVPGGGGSAFAVDTDGDGANGRVIIYW